MAHIFVSYADGRFKESLNRIARQAKRITIFDKIIKYTPKDLPDYIKALPLMAYSKGGGYWCWKPYIIYHTLQNCDEGDVVFYADAGCTLNKNSEEWQQFLQQAKHYNGIFFQYRDGIDYGDGFCGHSPELRHWTKPKTATFFEQFIDSGFLNFNKIWGGFMLFRKTKPLSIILSQWLNITLFHPELIIDPMGEELDSLPQSFVTHRHDQSVLTALVYHYQQQDNVLVLPETAESRIGNPAVLATRWRQAKLPFSQHLKYRLWCLLHGE